MADNYKILAQDTAKSLSLVPETSTAIEEILNHVGIFSVYPASGETPNIINLDSYSGTLPVTGDVYYIDHPTMSGIALVDRGSTPIYFPEVYISFDLQDPSSENAQALSDYFATNPQSLVLTAIVPVISFANQANALYTVPENTQASISSISLINTAEENVEYSLGVIKAEDVASSAENYNNVYETISPNGFVAVAQDIYAAYSADGIAWTQTSMPTTPGGFRYEWQSLANGQNKVVAIAYGSSAAAYSTDGINWIQTTLPADILWRAVAYGNGKFVAIAQSNSTAAYSIDGITWTQTSMPYAPNPGWGSIAFGNGKFVAVAQFEGNAAYSTDGVAWTQATGSPTDFNWSAVAYGNDKFVAVGNKADTSPVSLVSTDGISWTENSLSVGSITYWKTLIYGAGKFIALPEYANGGAYSTDGITWTQFSAPAFVEWRSITYGDGKFVAVSRSNSYHSIDGITWTQSSLPPINGQWQSVTSFEISETETVESSINLIRLSQTIIPTRSIEPNVVDEIVGGITLSAGDQVRIYSESPDLIVQVYGVEIA